MADQPPDGYGFTANSPQAESWQLEQSQDPLRGHQDKLPHPTDPANKKATPPSSELLDAVLQETISLFSHEDADRWIANWQKTNGNPPLHHDTVTKLVGDLLQKQFQSWRSTESERQTIALWLWEDPVARQKLESLWASRNVEQP